MSQKKRRRKRSYLKRFAMRATASAVLTMTAKTALASACPAEIMGTSLAGVTCDFTNNESVTVKNGGSLGGIVMNGYNPASAQIVIDAGGFLGGATVTGIAVTNSTLTNGIVNNGTINTDSNSLGITDSTIGSITNNGSIISHSGTAIRAVNSSTINGSIINGGTITSDGVFNNITVGLHSAMSGDITNTGTLNTTDSGNGILLFFTSTMTGNISNSGTINAGNTGISLYVNAALTGNIINSGTITSTNLDGIRVINQSSVSGAIENTGAIHAGTTGIAVHSASSAGSITNSGTINGGTVGISINSTSTVSGGITNSGVIEGGTDAIFIDSPSTVGGINIVGQSAQIIGEVNAVSTNFNIDPDATFTSEGTFSVNNFNIDSGAIFNMRNTITAQHLVTNAGTLSLGNTLSNINSTNGYVQSAGGILQTTVTNGTTYGKLLVDNAVDLSSSGNINVQVASNASLTVGTILSNVISGSTLTDPIGGFNVTDNSALWKFTATNNGNTGVNLTATIDPNIYNACLGKYCAGAANTIIAQVAAGNAVFSPYATLATNVAFQTAASQSTPELDNENIQMTQLLTRSVTDNIPMWNILHGVSGTDDMLLKPQRRLWVKPYDASLTQDASDSVDGFNSNAYGVVMGRDSQPTATTWLGGAIAAGGDEIDGNAALTGQSINTDSYEGMIYGAKKLTRHVYFAGQGLLGYGDNDTHRSLTFDNSSATGSYNSWFTNVRTQLGYSVYTHQNFVFTPVIDANYLFVDQQTYQESGSPFDLSVNTNTNSSLVLSADGYGAYHLPGGQQDLTLIGYIGLAQSVFNNQPTTTATFTAGGSSFTTFGVQLDRIVFRSGIGLTIANPKKPVSVNLNYDMQAGNNAFSNAGALTVVYKMS